jgi:hypothetical protein
MIEPVKYLPSERSGPKTLDSVDGKIELLTRKINEMIEVLNKWEKECAHNHKVS